MNFIQNRFFTLLLLSGLILNLGCKSKDQKGGTVAQAVTVSGADSCTVELRIDIEANEHDEDFDLPTGPGVEISAKQTVTASTCEGVEVGAVFSMSDAEVPGQAKLQRYIESAGPSESAKQKIVVNFDTSTSGESSYFTANGSTLTATMGTACEEGLQGIGQFISGQTNDYKITIHYKITFSENGCTPDKDLNFKAT